MKERDSPLRESKEPSKYESPSRVTYPEKRQSPLKQSDEEELVRSFKEQISQEQELEDAKVRLAMQSDFNLSDAFAMIDRDSNGWISVDEMCNSLMVHGVYAVREDVQLFVKRYDRNQDGKLRYTEFCDAFTPKAASYAAILNARKANYMPLGYPKTEYFMRDTRELYLKTVKIHLSVEVSGEFLRKRLMRRPGFNAHDAFVACDTDKNGYITKDEFKKILREYGFYASDNEITWLVERYDKNQDGKISYSEFIDEILPKSPTR